MEKDKMKVINDALNEVRYFAKEIREYLYTIEKERPLTEKEKSFWNKERKNVGYYGKE